jgi:hypothetical protein
LPWAGGLRARCDRIAARRHSGRSDSETPWRPSADPDGPRG